MRHPIIQVTLDKPQSARIFVETVQEWNYATLPTNQPVWFSRWGETSYALTCYDDQDASVVRERCREVPYITNIK